MKILSFGVSNLGPDPSLLWGLNLCTTRTFNSTPNLFPLHASSVPPTSYDTPKMCTHMTGVSWRTVGGTKSLLAKSDS